MQQQSTFDVPDWLLLSPPRARTVFRPSNHTNMTSVCASCCEHSLGRTSERKLGCRQDTERVLNYSNAYTCGVRTVVHTTCPKTQRRPMPWYSSTYTCIPN